MVRKNPPSARIRCVVKHFVTEHEIKGLLSQADIEEIHLRERDVS